MFSIIWLLYIISFSTYMGLASDDKVIEVQYQLLSDTYLIHISIGDPFQRIFFVISLSQEFSFTNSILYVKERSSFYSHYDIYPITINNQTVIAEEISDSFEIYKTDCIIKDFHFLLLTQKYLGFQSQLSFSYNNNRTDLNFIDALFNQKVISRKQFSFSKVEIENKGTLYLGELQKNITEKKFKYSCEVNKKHSSWGCDIQDITIGETKIPLNEYASFSVELSSIISTSSFFNSLYDNLFKQYIVESKCKLEENDSKFRYYYCDCDSVEEGFPTFFFSFGEMIIPIEGKELFNKLSRYCFFNIKTYNSQQNEWIIGLSIIKKYITQFDYDKGTITFYSDKPLPNINNSQNIILLLIYVIDSILCFGVIMVIIYTLKTKY